MALEQPTSNPSFHSTAKVLQATYLGDFRSLTADDWLRFAAAITFDELKAEIAAGEWNLIKRNPNASDLVKQKMGHRLLLGAKLFLSGDDDGNPLSFSQIAKQIGDGVNRGRIQTILQDHGIKAIKPSRRRTVTKIDMPDVFKAKIPPLQEELDAAFASEQTGNSNGTSGQLPRHFAICRIHALAFSGRAAEQVLASLENELGELNPVRPDTLLSLEPVAKDQEAFRAIYGIALFERAFSLAGRGLG